MSKVCSLGSDPPDLITSRPDVYGNDSSTLKFVYSYLINRKQKAKVGNDFMKLGILEEGFPQGPVLVPHFLNVHIIKMSLTIDFTIEADFADDTTVHVTEKKCGRLSINQMLAY